MNIKTIILYLFLVILKVNTGMFSKLFNFCGCGERERSLLPAVN